MAATVKLTTVVGGLSTEDYKNVVAHELGHAIGLRHKGRPGTMMHKFFFQGLDAYLRLARPSLRMLDRNYD